MSSSVFGTKLKIALRNKDEYHKDNGKKKRTKEYNIENLANDIGYHVNTIYNWTKSRGQLPSLTVLKEIADFLGVDTAYLLGEQVCQRNADQTICSVTELNEASAKVLSGLGGIEADMMNELLSHKDFGRLILLAWDYTRSHNKKITVTNTLDDSEDIPLVSDSQKEMMKYRVAEAFGKILDDIYDSHRPDAMDAKVGSILARMKTDIEEFIEYKDDEKIRQGLLRIISRRLDEIKEIRPGSLICEYTPEYIVDNFDAIKNAI